ncbi:uncharacterized protein TEOVI_000802500 [Trypanosoma equiperdum]|uniref:Uncharacterized protein n=2 Tax=Trypanozoon TaxID=39700 RepID=C9ZW37_TRYB9|nr:hypothetical protein, conserved [Trypanosoma brucei gambiense DAL972]CBH13626.1 hypothetical protein, conserved [Trypanosoma brucei gambiense DAL972]SCU67201.1 hypothetical protein, conserved [Trypanosoma equiperdum]|eukprot:XP_011775902.1 hypothetical protein, conserved [Trypanosoma brucei gambiense DAL972]
MRRFPPAVGVSLRQLRLVASPAVVRNVPPVKSFAPLGAAATNEDVARAFNVPPALLENSCRPAECLFAKMDLARSRFAPLIATIGSEDVTKIAAEVRVAKMGKSVSTSAVAPPSRTIPPVAGAKEKFKTNVWKSVRELVTFYEEVMLPVRVKNEEFKFHELNNFHIKDDLKRGLSAFKQDYLDNQKVKLVEVQKQMEACQKFIRDIGASSFDTNIFNDIANILRICGERNPYALRLSLQVLEDMSLVGVPFDDITTKILNAAVFNDGPLDDSALLFTLLEYPERGEVSVATKPVEKIADETLEVISRRHRTPLDNGKLLRQSDTHPCLQRSPE